MSKQIQILKKSIALLCVCSILCVTTFTHKAKADIITDVAIAGVVSCLSAMGIDLLYGTESIEQSKQTLINTINKYDPHIWSIFDSEQLFVTTTGALYIASNAWNAVKSIADDIVGQFSVGDTTPDILYITPEIYSAEGITPIKVDGHIYQSTLTTTSEKIHDAFNYNGLSDSPLLSFDTWYDSIMGKQFKITYSGPFDNGTRNIFRYTMQTRISKDSEITTIQGNSVSYQYKSSGDEVSPIEYPYFKIGTYDGDIGGRVQIVVPSVSQNYNNSYGTIAVNFTTTWRSQFGTLGYRPLAIDNPTHINIPTNSIDETIDGTGVLLNIDSSIDTLNSRGVAIASDVIAHAINERSMTNSIDDALSDTYAGAKSIVSTYTVADTQSLVDSITFAPTIDETETETEEIVLPFEKIESVEHYQYSLTDFFPFCLPFDFYKFLQCLSATPVTPEFNVTVAGTTLHTDAHPLDEYAPIFRRFILFGYIVSLIWSSKKIIRGDS